MSSRDSTEIILHTIEENMSFDVISPSENELQRTPGLT